MAKTNGSNTPLLSIFWGPLIALILVFTTLILNTNTPIWPAIAVTFWTLTWWLQNRIPIAITSLIPLVWLTAFKIIPLQDAIALYYSPIILLFLGGFLLGLMLEKWNIHERIAIGILKKSGNSPASIILGVMLASYVISMWISNTATAIMMLPIVMSIFKVLDNLVERELSKKMAYGALLGVAYGANIGGIATVIGTPPNLVLKAYLEKIYGSSPNFLEWMLVGIPFSLLLLGLVYLLFSKILFRLPNQPVPNIQQYIQQRTIQMGKVSIPQKRALFIFSGAALFWITSDLLNLIIPLIPFFKTSSWRFTDTNIALLFAFVAFITPSGSPFSARLLTPTIYKKVSWSILLMFGGGMTLAKGLSNAGILSYIKTLSASIPPHAWLLLCTVLIIMSVFLTEIMSNVALITILIPVVLSLSDSMGFVSPLIMSIPVTLAASLAFMMPISTPPNAVVFSSKMIPLHTMIKTGIGLNIISVFLLILLSVILHYFYA